MLKFDLSAPRELRFEVSPSDLGISQAKFSEIQVHVGCESLDHALQISVNVSARVRLECDRTLREFVSHVANTHELLLCPDGQELDEDVLIELIELDPRQRVFDLTDVVRDTLMLAIPTRKIAPDAEDLQIRTVFGAPPVAVDPRWSALLAIRQEQSLNE